MENTETSLLEKLRNDLNEIVSNNEVFKKTQDDLNRFCETRSGVITATELEEIFKQKDFIRISNSCIININQWEE